jgi:formate/nitrite transporter FocA (FNT family)
MRTPVHTEESDDDSQSASQHNSKDQRKEDEREEQEVSARSSPSGRVVYQSIVKEADEELERSSQALFWSGLAAGLSMGFSMAAEGLMQHYLPQARWTPLVSKLGYSVGFVVIILGRQQLFTENTLTPMLPLLKRKDSKTFLNVMRLWGVVLAANLIGALAIALVAARTGLFEQEVRQEFVAMGEEAMKPELLTLLLRGVFAGWLIALLVWMLPYAESSHFFVIVLITWLIGVAKFSHIIAGAVEVFALGWTGGKPWGTIFGHYIAPVLAGNIAGGVTLVAALNHAQVCSGNNEES